MLVVMMGLELMMVMVNGDDEKFSVERGRITAESSQHRETPHTMGEIWQQFCKLTQTNTPQNHPLSVSFMCYVQVSA